MYINITHRCVAACELDVFTQRQITSFNLLQAHNPLRVVGEAAVTGFLILEETH